MAINFSAWGLELGGNIALTGLNSARQNVVSDKEEKNHSSPVAIYSVSAICRMAMHVTKLHITYLHIKALQSVRTSYVDIRVREQQSSFNF